MVLIIIHAELFPPISLHQFPSSVESLVEWVDFYGKKNKLKRMWELQRNIRMQIHTLCQTVDRQNYMKINQCAINFSDFVSYADITLSFYFAAKQAIMTIEKLRANYTIIGR